METLDKIRRWMPKTNMNQYSEIWATMKSKETEMPPEDEGYISYVELRQSAIGDAKEFRDNLEILEIDIKNCNTPESRATVKWAMEFNTGAYRYILKKFNLTEEDLR